MPNKEETLQSLAVLIKDRSVTQNEVLSLFKKGGSAKQKTSALHNLTIGTILYAIGGIIILIGIVILIAQNWSDFNDPTKILVTLGSSIAAYILGIVLQTDNRTKEISPVFHVLSFILAPLGLYTLLDTQGVNAGSFLAQSIISGILVIFYTTSFFVVKRDLFLAFTIIAGTWLYFVATNYLINYFSFTETANILKLNEYRVLAIGTSFIALGNYFKSIKRPTFTKFLNFFGINMILAPIFALGGWTPNQNVFWEAIYPLVVFGAIFVSITVKSQSFLIFGTLYLMGYILKITAEYFTDTIGWPLALVISGFLLIIIGYFYVYIKRSFLTPKSS